MQELIWVIKRYHIKKTKKDKKSHKNGKKTGSKGFNTKAYNEPSFWIVWGGLVLIVFLF